MFFLCFSPPSELPCSAKKITPLILFCSSFSPTPAAAHKKFLNSPHFLTFFSKSQIVDIGYPHPCLAECGRHAPNAAASHPDSQYRTPKNPG